MLLAIRRMSGVEQTTLVAPLAGEVILAGDTLTVLGKNGRLAEVEKIP